MNNLDWLELKIEISRELEYLIYDILYALPITGIEIIDNNTALDIYKNKPDWVIFEKNDFLRADTLVYKTYLQKDEDINKNLDWLSKKIYDIKLNNKNSIVKFSCDKTIEDSDWSSEWKKHYNTFKIGKNIVINPIWKKYVQKEEEIVIDIDPGMAFGTGTHETTYLSLLAMESIDLKNKLVYDIGTGSGILAIAAVKLGANSVIATDIDDLCIEATKQNIKMNKVDGKIKVILGSLDKNIDKRKKADVVVSNILANILIELISGLKNILKNNGLFIASGIIKEKLDLVLNSLEDNNFEILEISTKNEWCTIIGRNNNA